MEVAGIETLPRRPIPVTSDGSGVHPDEGTRAEQEDIVWRQQQTKNSEETRADVNHSVISLR